MILFYLYLFILGSAIGSFLNVLIDRLPNEESIMGRSRCDYCKKELPAGVNIPILSWFSLRGKTQCCGKSLSLQYPLIELITGLIFILPIGPIGLISHIGLIGLICVFLVIFVADWKYHIIPDSMQVLFLVFSILYLMGTGRDLSVQIIINGLIVMLPILVLFLVTLGRGMGFADVKFAFTMGVLLGMVNGLLALYIAFILGAIVGICMIILKRKKMKSMIAFGPFLIIGTVVMLIWSPYIISIISRFYPL